MNPKEAGSRLAGVRYGKLQRIGDRRGSFAELWRASTFGELGLDVAGLPDARFVQANLSTSARGVLRGSTTHRRQLDYWTVVGGRALVALVDVRPVLADPSAHEVVETRELSEGRDGHDPRGRGPWLSGPGAALAALSSHERVRRQRRAGIRLGRSRRRHSLAAVPGTPDGRPILSDRDRSNPMLRELVERVRSI